MRKMAYLGLIVSFGILSCSEDKGSDSNGASSCTMPSSCEPGNGSKIEVLCPENGQEFAAGDSIAVLWRANVLDFTGFVPQVSIDGGETWTTLSNGSVEAVASGGEFQCFFHKTVVPEDGSWTPDGTDNEAVVFRVKDYSSVQASMRATSGTVTILGE